MPTNVSIGLSKKKGLPDFGSIGASCHVEMELDSQILSGDQEQFRQHVRRAYNACRQAVEEEIAATDANQTNRGQHSQPVNRVANHSTNGSTNGRSEVRNATSSQVRAIFAIANRNGVDLPPLLNSQFSVARPEDLSIRDASALIDQLKGSANGSNGSVAR
jgi:hypothetical protein